MSDLELLDRLYTGMIIGGLVVPLVSILFSSLLLRLARRNRKLKRVRKRRDLCQTR